MPPAPSGATPRCYRPQRYAGVMKSWHAARQKLTRRQHRPLYSQSDDHGYFSCNIAGRDLSGAVGFIRSSAPAPEHKVVPPRGTGVPPHWLRGLLWHPVIGGSDELNLAWKTVGCALGGLCIDGPVHRQYCSGMDVRGLYLGRHMDWPHLSPGGSNTRRPNLPGSPLSGKDLDQIRMRGRRVQLRRDRADRPLSPD